MASVLLLIVGLLVGCGLTSPLDMVYLNEEKVSSFQFLTCSQGTCAMGSEDVECAKLISQHMHIDTKTYIVSLSTLLL